MKNNLKQFKLFTVILFSLMALSSLFMTANAQENQGEAITDEELQTYAMVMDSIDAMKENIQDELNEAIQSEELMDGGRKYVAIQGAAGDSVKLQELQVTEEEMMVYNNIQATYEEMTTQFKENYTTLIKDDLGAAAYNKITKALNSDEAVKARYDVILNGLKEKRKLKKEASEGGTPTETPVEG